MALVSSGYKANITLADQEGNKSTLRYDLVAATAADAETAAGTLVTRLNAVTDAVVVGYNVGQAYEEDTTFYAATGVQIENIAMISARIAGTQEKWAQLRIPAPTIGIFQAASGKMAKVVDPADADLVAYLNSFVATTGLATISDGENLVSPGTAGNVVGKRIHRASRGG